MSFTVNINSAADPNIDVAKHNFDQWLRSSSGKYYWEREAAAIEEHLKYLPGPHVLSLGTNLSALNTAKLAAERDFPYLYATATTKPSPAKALNIEPVQKSPTDNQGMEQIRICSAMPEALPFATDSMASILATHSLEMCAQPDQVLREIKRILQPEGYVLFTGFNTISPSYWGIGKWALRGTKYPKTIWHPRLADWLRLLEFEVVASSMFAYAPTSIAPKLPRASSSIEHAGNRWWPLLGGAYILVARNTVLGRKLVGGRISTLLAQGKAVLGSGSASSSRQVAEVSDESD